MKHNKKFHYLLVFQCLWLVLLILLASWWGFLVSKQAKKIVFLENQLGWSAQRTHADWHQTHRMLLGESISFFLLWIVFAGFLLWISWREFKRNQSLHIFFASFTHEFRTPLSSIRLQTEALMEDSKIDQPLLQRLFQDTLRLESYLQRTLEVSRLHSGEGLWLQALSPQDSIQECLRYWNQQYPETLTVSVSGENRFIWADPWAFQMIFYNIFQNSWQHSGQSPLVLSILFIPDSSFLKILCWDHGQGCTEKLSLLGTLFPPSPGAKRVKMGLYLIKNFVERMGGKINLFSSLKKGFEIHLTFPLDKTSV